MLVKIILLSMMLARHSLALDPWTKTDTGLELSFQLVNIIDWNQTSQLPVKFAENRVVTDHTGRTRIITSYYVVHEGNPLLGKNPSQAKVNTHFASYALGHYIISRLLPARFRRPWQSITIGFSTGCVVQNYSIGIKFKI